MIRSAFVLACIVLTLLATAPASAASRHAGALEKLAQPISLDLLEAAPVDVFASFGKILGLSVALDPDVSTPITIKFNRVSIETSMRAICESIDCVWRLEAGQLVVSPVATVLPAPVLGPRMKPFTPLSDLPAWNEPLSISLEGANFDAVIATFAKILEIPIDVAPELAEEKVSIELQSVPARDALTALLELVDAELVESSTAPRRLAVRKRG